MHKGLPGLSRLGRMILAIALLTTGSALADAAKAGMEVKLSGSFNWGKNGKTESLMVALTPAGTNAWKAVFSFNWDKKPHTWLGSVKGHLDNGEISGEATAEGGRRTFTFNGTASNHQITFQHTETTGGKNVPTGDCTLQPAAG